MPVAKLFVFILCLVPALGAYAQTDTSFWFAAPEVSQQHADRPIQLKLATGAQAANIRVSQPANPAFPVQTVYLPPNTAHSVDLTNYIDLVENRPANQVLNKGLLIQSSSFITAYYEVNTQLNPDIFTLKGRNALGNEFFIPFQTLTSNSLGGKASFDIVATEDNTTVTITPNAALIGRPAGQTFTITLNRGQSWSGEANGVGPNDHPTGTKVTSNKPIAITVKDDSIEAGLILGGTCKDLIGDQLVPTSILGTEYIVQKGFLSGADRYLILTTQPNTSVFIDGVLNSTVNAGITMTYSLTNPTAYITTSEPVYVFHISGFGCETGGAILPSLRCTGSYKLAITRSTSEFFGLNLLVQAGGQGNFLFNGQTGVINAASFNPVPGTSGQWFYAQVNVNAAIGLQSLIENTSHLFHLGVINGGSSSGCRYGFFSDYARLQYQIGINTQNEANCLGSTVVLNASNVPGSTLTWNGPNGLVSNSLSISLSNFDASQTGLYTVAGQLGACTVAADSVELRLSIPNAAITADVPLCAGVDTLLLVSSGSPAQGFDWTIPLGSGISGNDTLFIPLYSAAEQGVYTLVVTDSVGCQDTANFNALAPTQLSLVLNATSPACASVQDGSITALPSNGVGAYTYLWSNGATDSSINNLAAGNYTVTVQDAQGCEINQTYSLTEADPLQIIFVPQQVACANNADGSIEAMVTGGNAPYSYAWANGSTTAIISNLNTGMYALTITDNSGCTQTDSIPINQPAALQVLVQQEQISCAGSQDGRIALQVQGGTAPYQYSITPNVYQTQALFENLGPGTYNIEVLDANACSIQQSVQLYEPLPILIAAFGDTTIQLGQSAELSLRFLNTILTPSISWSPNSSLSCDDCFNPEARPTESTLYEVAVTDGFGCTVREQVQVNVEKFRDVFIPNAFSPDGDGLNDVFFVQAGPNVALVEQCVIFDRWGNQVFSTQNVPAASPVHAWDGTYKGKAAISGTYVYYIKLLYVDGQSIGYQGDVQLVR